MSRRRQLMIASTSVAKVPLTLTALSTESSVTLTKTGSPIVSGLQYRMGLGGEWLPYAIGTTLTLAAIGDTVQFCNTKDELGQANALNVVQFALTGTFSASGELVSMLNWREDLPRYSLRYLFKDCTGLVDISAMVFPTIIDAWALNMTFLNTGITSVHLPDIRVVNYSMTDMFMSCLNLTSAKLDLSSIGDDGTYPLHSLFLNCSSLNSIEVNFTSWGNVQTSSWVDGVAGTGTFIKPATLPKEFGVSRIPTGWTVVDK